MSDTKTTRSRQKRIKLEQPSAESKSLVLKEAARLLETNRNTLFTAAEILLKGVVIPSSAPCQLVQGRLHLYFTLPVNEQVEVICFPSGRVAVNARVSTKGYWQFKSSGLAPHDAVEVINKLNN